MTEECTLSQESIIEIPDGFFEEMEFELYLVRQVM